jgi:hypothetical protein
LQNSKDISNGEGSGDDLCFDEHMAQQEHGARRRYRQSIANLHFKTNGELDLQRGNRVEGGLSGRSERSTRLRGVAQWQQKSMAMEDLRRGREEGNMEGGSMDVLTTAIVFPSNSSPKKSYLDKCNIEASYGCSHRSWNEGKNSCKILWHSTHIS